MTSRQRAKILRSRGQTMFETLEDQKDSGHLLERKIEILKKLQSKFQNLQEIRDPKWLNQHDYEEAMKYIKINR